MHVLIVFDRGRSRQPANAAMVQVPRDRLPQLGVLAWQQKWYL